MHNVNLSAILDVDHSATQSIDLVGPVTVELSGDVQGQAVLQKSQNMGMTWQDVLVIAPDVENDTFEREGCKYRVAISSDGNWSGAAEITISGYNSWAFE